MSQHIQSYAAQQIHGLPGLRKHMAKERARLEHGACLARLQR